MEFNPQSNRPLVRIGILQSEKKMSFSAHGPFRMQDLSGVFKLRGEPGQQYDVSILSNKPAIIQPMIRLGIRYQEEDAQALANQWKEHDLPIQIVRTGENIRISESEYLDNREYWILASGFDSLEEAENTRRELPDFGSYQAVLIHEVSASGKILIEGNEFEQGVRLVPVEKSEFSFKLNNVRVGIGFHWDHRESQNLEGILEFRIDKKGLLTAVNVLDIERYLASVNSSEMVPDCSPEFLKAQTIAARCTVFATAGKHHYGEPFDLCADDHCQCFHGAGAIQKKSLQAALETRGQVLVHDGRVCDTRYAKICAGVGESYQNVWDNRHLEYLDKFHDSTNASTVHQTLENEEKLHTFIDSTPKVFCNPKAYPVPEYLNYGHDYFRWNVEYLPDELGEIVARKLGRDLGAIRDIIPQKRGFSGRMIYARIVGDLGESVVGKELEIRRVLSKSHLYSACFYVEKEVAASGKTEKLILRGGGWGHGVGICQVGAAVMAEQGFTCEEILNHYYKSTELKKIYD
jgi:SpoIID/LytB domain protein